MVVSIKRARMNGISSKKFSNKPLTRAFAEQVLSQERESADGLSADYLHVELNVRSADIQSMTDALRRAIRTFVQTFLGVVISSGILSAAATDGVVDWSGAKKVAVSAMSAAVVAVLTFVQNALEDGGQIPAILKAPASSGENPVPEDAS
jgi:ABC-type multidrug transport system fused ATPase/permease subunit